MNPSEPAPATGTRANGGDREEEEQEVAPAELRTVVFDSDVMFDPFRRYLLLSLVVRRAFVTRWSDALIGEWTQVIVREERTTPDQAERQFRKLTADFPEAHAVPGVHDIERAKAFVHDPGDAHVAACALAVAPCVLLTYNVKHFRVTELRAAGVEVRKPSPWLAETFATAPRAVQHDWIAGLHEHRKSMSNPPYDLVEYLEKVASRQLPAFAHAVGAAFVSAASGT